MPSSFLRLADLLFQVPPFRQIANDAQKISVGR
jgi:hypothetical protein